MYGACVCIGVCIGMYVSIGVCVYAEVCVCVCFNVRNVSIFMVYSERVS